MDEASRRVCNEHASRIAQCSWRPFKRMLGYTSPLKKEQSR